MCQSLAFEMEVVMTKAMQRTSARYGVDRGSVSGVALVLVVIAVLLALIFFSGVQAGKFRIQNADAQMRHRLTRQIIGIAGAINPDLVAKLSFSPQDIGTPAFDIIHDQLVSSRKSLENRGIYTIARRDDGQIVFGPETYDPDDPIASVPGTVYQQVPAEVLSIFDNPVPVTMGPYTDEYGTFVTALAPVIDPGTGQVVLVLGLDILADQWKAQVAAAGRGPLLMILGGSIILCVCLVLIGWWNHHLSMMRLNLKGWIVVPVGIAMAVGMFMLVLYEHQQYHQGLRRDMTQLTDHVSTEWRYRVFNEVKILQSQFESYRFKRCGSAGLDGRRFRRPFGCVLANLRTA